MVVDIRANPARWWKRRSRRGFRAPAALFVGTVRRIISITILSGLVTVVVAVWYVTRSDRICRLSEVLLRSVTGGQVFVANGHLSLSGTLVLTGVSLQTPKTDSENAAPHALPLFSAEQIELRFDWFSLFTGSLHATQLTAVHPTLYLIEDREEGKWNYEMLQKKQPETKPSVPIKTHVPLLPVILLRDARVQWGEWTNNHLIQTADTTIEGQLAPTLDNPTTFRFQFVQRVATIQPTLLHAEPVLPLSSLATSSSEADSNPDPHAGITLTGAWDVANNRVEASVHSIDFSDLLRRALPRQVRNWWDEHKLAGRLEQLEITFDERGLRVGVEAQDISMVQQVIPPGPAEDRQPIDVALNHVSGSFLFSNNPTSLHVGNLRGQILGFNFIIEGDLNFASTDSPLDLRVRFPHATFTLPYPPLFMAFHESQDLMQRTQPLGTMDLDIKVHRDAGKKDLHVNGDIFCRGSQMRFAPIPFPLRDVDGHILFSEKQFEFKKVTAMADENPILINGVAGTTPTNCFIDFAVSSDRAHFDDRMGASLPAQFQGVWDAFSIVADGGFLCRVTRPNNPNIEPNVDVAVNVTDGKGYIKALPYYFSHAVGKIHFTPEQTTIDNLVLHAGAHNEGIVTVNGIVKHPHGDVAALRPQLNVKASLPIEDKLLNALPEKFSHRLEGVQVGGTLIYDGSVGSVAALSLAADSQSQTSFDGTLQIKNGTVAIPAKQLAFRDIAVDATISPAAISIKSVEGLSAEGLKLSGSGDFKLIEGSGTATVLLKGDLLTLPAQPFAFLPPAARELWNTWHPAGTVGIDGSLTLDVDPAHATADILSDYSVRLHPLGMSLRNPAYPTITDINGSLHLTPDRIALDDLAVAVGPLHATLNGGYLPKTGATTIVTKGNAKGVTSEWMKTLPAPIGPMAAAHPFSGDFILNRLNLSRIDASSPWLVDADATADTFTATDPFSIKAESLHLTAGGSYDKAFVFAGRFNAKTLALADRPIRDITGAIAYVPEIHQLHVTQISGKLSSGTLTADILLATHPDPTLIITADLKDALLSGLINPGVEKTQSANEGTLAGNLSLSQRLGDHPARNGSGDISITNAKLYNVPFALGLLQIATLRLPTTSAFSHAAMNYTINNDTIKFDRILMEGRNISLAGQGTVNVQNKNIAFNFVTQSPEGSKLPILSTIVDTIRGELLQLSITGTLTNPRITPVPLTPIANTLGAFLPRSDNSSSTTNP